MADQEKLFGNEQYKKKNFPQALEHYRKAISLDPTQMLYYLNAASALLEQSQFDEAIEMCTEAIRVGEENKGSFKNMGKAYVRMGNVYYRKGDLGKAKEYYDRSLLEDRSPEIVSKIYQVEREMREKKARDYINPELSQQEKLKGNELFKEGEFPKAIEHYSEAIKRNPADARLYSNRAACYASLLAYPSALKDCEEAIKLDPAFIKPYLRQGAIYRVMKEMYKARKAYETALELDGTCAEAREGLLKCSSGDGASMDTIRQQAMQDPEIQKIISDPAMRVILEQAQSDPSSLMEHLKNPVIAANFEKLVKAGIVGVK